VRVVCGAPTTRPRPADVVAALRRLDVDVMSLRTEGALLLATDVRGRRLVVHVLDRDHVGALRQLWRFIRLQDQAPPLSLRRSLDHRALMAMAIPNAGVRTERLVGAMPVASD